MTDRLTLTGADSQRVYVRLELDYDAVDPADVVAHDFSFTPAELGNPANLAAAKIALEQRVAVWRAEYLAFATPPAAVAAAIGSSWNFPR